MTSRFCLLLCILCMSCGYKLVGRSAKYRTVTVRPVTVTDATRGLGPRMRDSLIERCLAGSGLQPAAENGDLILETRLHDYAENIIATGVDGRTSRIQFNLNASFELTDRKGKRIWSLENYRYSDQYEISTARQSYRDEAVFVQDQALRTISDLVITNLTLAIAEWGDSP